MNIDRTSVLRATNRLSDVKSSQDKTMSRIASGKRILAASDDPAGMAVATAIEAATRGMNMQIANRQDEISLMQTADSALSNVGDMLGRINELSIQAANGTLTNEDRSQIQLEIQQLKQQVAMTAETTQFNSKKLFDGELDMTLQNGNAFKLPRIDADSLGISSLDLSTTEGAGAAISSSGQAIEQVTSERSRIGAVTNGLTEEISGLQNVLYNSTEALSKIADADMAREIVSLTLSQVQSQAAMQAFKIENDQRGNILGLLNA